MLSPVSSISVLPSFLHPAVDSISNLCARVWTAIKNFFVYLRSFFAEAATAPAVREVAAASAPLRPQPRYAPPLPIAERDRPVGITNVTGTGTCFIAAAFQGAIFADRTLAAAIEAWTPNEGSPPDQQMQLIQNFFREYRAAQREGRPIRTAATLRGLDNTLTQGNDDAAHFLRLLLQMLRARNIPTPELALYVQPEDPHAILAADDVLHLLDLTTALPFAIGIEMGRALDRLNTSIQVPPQISIPFPRAEDASQSTNYSLIAFVSYIGVAAPRPNDPTGTNGHWVAYRAIRGTDDVLYYFRLDDYERTLITAEQFLAAASYARLLLYTQQPRAEPALTLEPDVSAITNDSFEADQPAVTAASNISAQLARVIGVQE